MSKVFEVTIITITTVQVRDVDDLDEDKAKKIAMETLEAKLIPGGEYSGCCDISDQDVDIDDVSEV